MELHSHSAYNQIIQFVKQLSKPEKRKLISEIEKELETKKSPTVLQGNLLQFAGSINAAELQTIARVIEDGCERIDHDEW